MIVKFLILFLSTFCFVSSSFGDIKINDYFGDSSEENVTPSKDSVSNKKIYK